MLVAVILKKKLQSKGDFMGNSRYFTEEANKGKLITQVMELVEQIGKRIQAEDDEEHRWLLQHCTNLALQKLLKDMTVMELHVVDAVGRLEPVNGITISKTFGIPKGSVSKITRRLMGRKLIQSEFLPNNKKEILFVTTPLGKELFELHHAMHQQIERNAIQFLQKYESEELALVSRILKDSLETSWVNSEPRVHDDREEAE
ncbi:MarR family transcriptional regulator [Paenibacillus sp. RC67]|uniref:MarR family transcriptional regulator n=1 Tax=Paenibacillus sp. RC67 TaxID=3039392 RepID=UPI0024ADA4F5|nr:MarR family transcriptional regulator [Paenibacillus sp. RC67]